jgi:hypothetical protein
MEKNGWGSIYPKSHWGVNPKIIPKNNKLFLGIICTQRTPIIELILARFG